MAQPNILFVMTDQQRFDTIAALGNAHIRTPNMDRLARRGLAFTQAFSTCPVCMPARYTIRTGREPPTTRSFANGRLPPSAGQAAAMEDRCGPYLARTLRGRGYRAFGVGKFHAHPWDEDLGFEVHLHSEELYETPDQRQRDAYAAWIAREHPGFDFLENFMGERSEMYYVPQMSPLPAALTVESWAADHAAEQIRRPDDRPWFGFVSFIGPHPPLAPPIPFNRMYDPDRMPDPVRGERKTDHVDEQIPWMNHQVWAEEINDSLARVLKARYYGEISHIDSCLGRILDAVDARGDAENTLIAFFSDHGDHLGDHHAWQKESFFDASCRIPFLLSWPARLPANRTRDDLVCLTDLFGIATGASGATEVRDGADVLGIVEGAATARDALVGWHGEPGTPSFKVMVRDRLAKYIFMANGGREQLFDVIKDPNELKNLAAERPEVVRSMRALAVRACDRPGAREALNGNDLRHFPFRARPLGRTLQFDLSRGIRDFSLSPPS